MMLPFAQLCFFSAKPHPCLLVSHEAAGDFVSQFIFRISEYMTGELLPYHSVVCRWKRFELCACRWAEKAFIAPRVKTRRKNINTRPGIYNSHARNTGHSIKLLTRNRYRFVAFFATRTLNISHAPLKWLACTFFYFPLCFMFYRRSMPTTCFRGLIERDYDLFAFPPIFQIINFHFIYNQLIKFKLNPFDER